MKREEMKQRCEVAMAKDTELNNLERRALLDQYDDAWNTADLCLMQEVMMMKLSRIAGVLEFLNYLGKIKDEEDLWMLMNEIESYWYKRVEEVTERGKQVG